LLHKWSLWRGIQRHLCLCHSHPDPYLQTVGPIGPDSWTEGVGAPMTTMLGNPVQDLGRRLLRGPIWPIIVLGYIAFVSYQVTEAPRSLLWRMLFLAGLLLIYYMPQRLALKLAYAAVVLLILVPVLGMSNPFLLELGFQICLYATL